MSSLWYQKNVLCSHDPISARPNLNHQKVDIQVLEFLDPIHISFTFGIILPENLQRINRRI